MKVRGARIRQKLIEVFLRLTRVEEMVFIPSLSAERFGDLDPFWKTHLQPTLYLLDPKGLGVKQSVSLELLNAGAIATTVNGEGSSILPKIFFSGEQFERKPLALTLFLGINSQIFWIWTKLLDDVEFPLPIQIQALRAGDKHHVTDHMAVSEILELELEDLLGDF